MISASFRIAAAAAFLLAVPGAASAQQAGSSAMTFFITSVGIGKGADLGGLNGADQHCQRLAEAARRQPHMARLSQHPGRQWPAGDQRARPHREGPLAKRQG